MWKKIWRWLSILSGGQSSSRSDADLEAMQGELVQLFDIVSKLADNLQTHETAINRIERKQNRGKESIEETPEPVRAPTMGEVLASLDAGEEIPPNLNL